jgi:hypothetical protein
VAGLFGIHYLIFYFSEINMGCTTLSRVFANRNIFRYTFTLLGIATIYHASTCKAQSQYGGKIKALYSVGWRPNTSGITIGLAFGGSLTSNWIEPGANIYFNLYQCNLGASSGLHRVPLLDIILSPSLTFGGEHAAPMEVNTFTGSSETGVRQQYKYSFTIGHNFVFSTEPDRRFQRVGSYGFRVSGFTLNIYNDSKIFLGDAGDRWWTGGGTAVINIGHHNSISFGTEPFTGNSISSRVLSMPYDMGMPTYNVRGKGVFHYAYQDTFDIGRPAGYNRSLNMGHSFIKFNGDYFTAQLSHSGAFHMYSQNFIHDYPFNGFHRFMSLVPNQLNLTLGPRVSIQ